MGDLDAEEERIYQKPMTELLPEALSAWGFHLHRGKIGKARADRQGV